MRSIPSGRRSIASAAAFAIVLLASAASDARAQVRHATFEVGGNHLVLEALDDDLIHFELGTGPASGVRTPLATSPMVARTEYSGARTFTVTGTSVRTAGMEIAVAPASLCFTVTDTRRRTTLTTICPAAPAGGEQRVTIARSGTQHVYGLGEQFTEPGEMNGDWLGRERVPGVQYGNRMVGFVGGAVGNALFPVMYALGAGNSNYALFIDHTYAQHWDFRGDPWELRTYGDELRGYIFTGADFPALRSAYVQLTGAPPVPPRQAFGLWVSEYGYEHWDELESKLATLRENRFPVDGFVLDLQWFGGIITGSDRTPMGSLTWDLKRFPNPRREIARLRTEHGLGIIPIEEPYIGRALAEHDSLAQRGFLVRQREGGPPVYLTENPWWGRGGMVDFTSDSAGTFWHDWKRQPLVDMGVTGHWTDLGEPELYDSTGWYQGVVPGKHSQADVHNLYNLKWSKSIVDGYHRNDAQRRPLILSRSGTSGSQRYGVAMWSGDIGANLPSLATHMNAQMHMSMSGMDYFGSDIGGFHRGSLQGDSLTEVYTQWFASGALLDVPVRVHAENLCNCKETAPDRAGDLASNRATLRLRYSLTPYYYALAHRARTHGEPLIAPLVHYYQSDTTVRRIGDQKLIGRDLMVAVVAEYGRRQRDVYLPRGTWYDFRSHERLDGGRWLRNVTVQRDSLFALPLYAREGAIIPRMHVDEHSMNVLGQRLDGSSRNELIARVYPGSAESQFELLEDDGATIAYLTGAIATTPLTQRTGGGRTTVVVGARQGSFAGASPARTSVVEFVPTGTVTTVTLNGTALTRHATLDALLSAGSGWTSADGLVTARSPERPAAQAQTFEFRMGR